METLKLYYENPRLQEFEAVVQFCRRTPDGCEIVLDRSVFYPEGGGQPCDRGWIAGAAVTAVRQESGLIYHLVASPPGDWREPKAGVTVTGRIDWARRFDFMQQHTGQHIVSAVILRITGIDTLSVHLGDASTSVELDAPSLSEQQLSEVEREANRIVRLNAPVRSRDVPREQIGGFALRKVPPPELASVRLIEIEGVEVCACGGTHVSSTGEVGLLKITGSEIIRGHLRLHWKIGERAYRDYGGKSELLGDLARDLGCRTEDLRDRVATTTAALRSCTAERAKLEERLAELLSERLLSRAETIPAGLFVGTVLAGESESLFRMLVDRLAEGEGRVVCLVNDTDGGLRLAVSADASTGLDPATLARPALSQVDGRGGGKGSRWQGNGSRRDGAAAFVATVRVAATTSAR